jgi:hypothetical protein
MIEQKQKPCKGNYRVAKFSGCGTPTYHRKYGLCASCLYEWMTTTETGKIYKAKHFDKKVQSNITKTRAKKTKAKKIEIMSNDEYRQKYVQPVINKIIRTIDHGQPCIASRRREGKVNAGHYISVGSNRTICINTHNIHAQSFESNHFKSGDERRYEAGIIEEYGLNYLDFMRQLQSCPPLHLTKDDLIEVKNKARKFLREIEPMKIAPEDRIRLRNQANEAIGIYPTQYSEFNGLIR